MHLCVDIRLRFRTSIKCTKCCWSDKNVWFLRVCSVDKYRQHQKAAEKIRQIDLILSLKTLCNSFKHYRISRATRDSSNGRKLREGGQCSHRNSQTCSCRRLHRIHQCGAWQLPQPHFSCISEEDLVSQELPKKIEEIQIDDMPFQKKVGEN